MQECKLNLAIIGLGNWGKKLVSEFNESHKIKYCHTKGNPQNISWLKKNFPKIKVVKQIVEIFDDESINAVIIATPIRSHNDLVKQSLLQNKHVFVEKPLTESVFESKNLIEIAKKKKLCLFIGNVFLYHPVFLKLQKLLINEKIKSISGTWLKMGTFHDDIITNLLYHDMCIIHELIGKPKKIVIANSQNFITKSDIIDVKIIFSNKIDCNLHINRISNIKRKSLTLITEKNCYLWENDTLFKFSEKNNYYEKIYESKQTALENECKVFSKDTSAHTHKLDNAQKSLEIIRDLESIL